MYRLDLIDNACVSFTLSKTLTKNSLYICPTLILAAILGEVLPGSPLVHNRQLHAPVVLSLLYVEAFKTQLCACSRSRRLFIDKGFSASRGVSLPVTVSLMRLLLIKCVSLERETENVRFPNCGENQENGDSTRTKKLQLQC